MTEKPTEKDFPAVMEKVYASIESQTPKEDLVEFSKSIKALTFEFPDVGLSFHLSIGDDGLLTQLSEPPEKVDCTISMSSETNHALMMGETNETKAFMAGKLKIGGFNPMKLQQILPKLGPMNEYYKKALEEI